MLVKFRNNNGCGIFVQIQVFKCHHSLTDFDFAIKKDFLWMNESWIFVHCASSQVQCDTLYYDYFEYKMWFIVFPPYFKLQCLIVVWCCSLWYMAYGIYYITIAWTIRWAWLNPELSLSLWYWLFVRFVSLSWYSVQLPNAMEDSTRNRLQVGWPTNLNQQCSEV